MIETGIREIDVDALMDKVQAEARRRRERMERKGDAPANVFLAGLDPRPFQVKQGGYGLNDLFCYHGRDFIINAYRAILDRPADSGGFEHFLQHLQSGKMTKAEILGRLRYSPEGRAKAVRIKGLWFHFGVQMIFRIPVLGAVVRWVLAVVNLPTMVRNFRALEAGSAAQWEQQREIGKALWKQGIENAEEIRDIQRKMRKG